VNGTLAGFGTSVSGFTTIDEAMNAHWLLSGTITSSGTLSIGAGAALRLHGPVSIGTILFAGAGGESLKLDTPLQFSSVFAGFGSLDVIDLAGIQADALNFANGTLTLYGAGNSVVDTLLFDGSYSNSNFALQTQGSGTEVLYVGAAPRETHEWHAGVLPEPGKW
jgi:hypothetical protein